jgi:hypothetical protein
MEVLRSLLLHRPFRQALKISVPVKQPTVAMRGTSRKVDDDAAQLIETMRSAVSTTCHRTPGYCLYFNGEVLIEPHVL